MLPKYRKPIHPGEILWEEFLVPLEISQSEFVRHLGGTWTQPKLSAIIRGRRAVTEAVALDLSDALGTSPEFWINMQVGINLWEAKKKRKKVRPLLRRKIRKKASSSK